MTPVDEDFGAVLRPDFSRSEQGENDDYPA
jgi:hypothetical protein